MAPRKRNPENKGLPHRWRHTYGAYRYQVPEHERHLFDGKTTFTLGRTLAQAWRTWADRRQNIDAPGRLENVGDFMDAFAFEVIPTLAPKTGRGYLDMYPRLRKSFGSARDGEIKPKHIYQYYDARAAKTAAKREIQLLSSILTFAIRKGAIDTHPFRGQIKLPNNAPRTRYVADWEIDAACSVDCGPKSGRTKNSRRIIRMMRAYIQIKIITGLSRVDLLLLEPARHFTDEGIKNTRHKTARKTGRANVIEWTPTLREAVDAALAARPVHISPYLFCNRRGEAYFDESTGTANGFDSLWQRFMDRVLQETDVVERFTEHDLRAKAASDADSDEHARALLNHTNSSVTKRVYRRKPERVKPIK